MITRGSAFGIADRVRSRKGTSAKATKATPKRKLTLPTSPTRSVRQKGQLSIPPSVEALPREENIHGILIYLM